MSEEKKRALRYAAIEVNMQDLWGDTSKLKYSDYN